MLPLALALSLAAPVPKATPFPLRTDPLPKEYKLADLEDAARPREVKGTVALLAWETVEDDRPRSVTRVLVLKRHEKTDEQGNQYTLTFMSRRPKDTDWRYRSNLPTILDVVVRGEDMSLGSDAYWHGSQDYAKPPTDEELAAFLTDVRWTPEVGQEVVTFFDGKRVMTTKLAAGGFERDAWKKHFDRDPPVDLFPELKTEAK